MSNRQIDIDVPPDVARVLDEQADPGAYVAELVREEAARTAVVPVSLPADAHAQFQARAEQAGLTLSAWLVAAGRERMLRESMQAYAEFIAQPQIAEQLEAFHAARAR
jgi:hypothetical protein